MVTNSPVFWIILALSIGVPVLFIMATHFLFSRTVSRSSAVRTTPTAPQVVAIPIFHFPSLYSSCFLHHHLRRNLPNGLPLMPTGRLGTSSSSARSGRDHPDRRLMRKRATIWLRNCGNSRGR